MLRRLFESRTARILSTVVLLLLALGAIAAAWAAPGKSKAPGTLSEHGPPAHSNSVHNRGDKPDRTAFGSGCEYGAAVAQWASGKTKDDSHCDNAGAQQARGSENKPPKAKSNNAKGKDGNATAGSSQARGGKGELDENEAEETEVEKPDADDTPSPTPSPSVSTAV
ncbi:MAG: hypothetical protein ACRDI3_00365 [Actinomycetota bacterium]